MSSPFTYFRKKQKLFMAIATGFAILVFVFLSGVGTPPNDNERTSRAAQMEVASWEGGSVNRGELANLRDNYAVTNTFLLVLFERSSDPDNPQEPRKVPGIAMGRQVSNAQLEQAALEAEWLAQQARKAGLSVSTEMINQYLRGWTLGRIDNKTIRDVLSRLSRDGEQRTENVVYSTLEKMLLKHYYLASFGDVSQMVMPSERYADWLKLNERVAVQTAVFATEDFLDKVPEPTDAQLLEYFNKYRERQPRQQDRIDGQVFNSPEPGFTIPHRVRLHVLKANIADESRKYLDDITDEQIEKHYEDNKDRLYVEDAEEDAAEEEAETGEEEADSEASAGEGDDATEQADSEESTEESDDASTEATAEESDASKEPSTEDSSTDDTSADTSAETEAAEAAAEEPQAAHSRRSPFRLAAYQNTEEDATEETEEGSTAEQPSEEGAEEAAASDSDKSEGETATSESSDDSGDDPIEEDRYAPKKYEPLEKVSDDIRQYLARVKAAEEIEVRMNDAYAELYQAYNRHYADRLKAEDEKTDPPAPPEKLTDLKPVAKKYSMTHDKLAPASSRELLERSLIARAREAQGQQRLVLHTVFRGVEAFEPLLVNDNPNQALVGDWAIVIKVEDSPTRVPKFDEVRDQVLEAWQREEASKLALAAAEEQSKKYAEASSSFHDYFNARKTPVKTTNTISYLKLGVAPDRRSFQAPLTVDPELPAAGPKIMDAIFSLEDDHTAVKLNYDHSAAYILKIHRREKTKKELKQVFLKEANGWLGDQAMANGDRQRLFQSITDQIHKLSGFKFNEAYLEARRNEQ